MLPTTRRGFDRPPSSHSYRAFVARKYLVPFVCAAAGLYFLSHLFTRSTLPEPAIPNVKQEETIIPPPLPPLYSNYHYDVLRLSQHHWERTSPGSEEKFFYVAGHARGTGWGNGMEEFLLNAYIAYKAGRSFVFGNYTWHDDGTLYSDYNGKKIPSQIPYNVMVRGPTVGDPYPAGDRAPLSVSRTYFEKVCPNPTTYIREDVHDHLQSSNNAKQITDGWVAKLHSTQDPCVRSAQESGQLFNYMVFGDKYAMFDIWQEFFASPIVAHFRWSPLIEVAFDMNRDLFFSGNTLPTYLSSLAPTVPNKERYPMIPGLLALHVRRGDFEAHCEHIAKWSSDFVAFNSFPELPDRFEVPPHEDWGVNTPENHAIYRSHCYPSVEQIVAKVRAARQTPAGRGLRKAFIMTNGKPDYIKELKQALWKEGGWDLISSSRDLIINWEQKYVAQAVDMLVGQRAQVVIGNGFSTMTSNIVMMRKANGFDPEGSRFF